MCRIRVACLCMIAQVKNLLVLKIDKDSREIPPTLAEPTPPPPHTHTPHPNPHPPHLTQPAPSHCCMTLASIHSD